MRRRCVGVLVWFQVIGALGGVINPVYASKAAVDRYPAWRAAAAAVLARHGDANSLATAAALTFLGPPSRSRPEAAEAAAAALGYAVDASEREPNNPAIDWLRLQLCTNVPSCDIRAAATTMRWVAAENSAAWLPILAIAQKDRDSIEIDRVLADMAQGTRFDIYAIRSAVLMFDALRRARRELPTDYLKSDAARLTEALGLANAAAMPSFSPLINACHDPNADAERRDACFTLAGVMQKGDAVLAQLAGFALEKRLTRADAKGQRALAERRRVLEWRVAATNRTDTTSLPWSNGAEARLRLAKMRSLAREEDVCTAILRGHKMPLEPREEHR